MAEGWDEVGEQYLEYLASENDQIRRALLDPILLELVRPHGKVILDVGCGEGYFARTLKEAGAARVVGIDIARDLVKQAKAQDPDGEYRVHDIVSAPTVAPETFDVAVVHMALMDVADLDTAYQRISESLVASGQLIVSIVNPYYAFPVGRWGSALQAALHRRPGPRYRRVFGELHGLLRRRFHRVLYITNYFEPRVVKKKLGGSEVPHFHRPLSEYLNLAAAHGLIMQSFVEPKISTDLHERFSEALLSHDLTRIPLFFALGFKKSGAVGGSDPGANAKR